jgi:heptosyltransferase I
MPAASSMSPLSVPQPKQLCLVRLSAIGDCCHTVPIVRTLQHAWPDTRIVWIVGNVEHQLLAGLSGVEFIVLDKSRGVAGYWELRRRLAGRRFPLLLHMHASMRANYVSLLVRADLKLGFDRARARDFQWLFCNAQIQAKKQQHVVDGLFGFAEALGINERILRWDIPLSDQDRAFARSQIADDAPALIISPCSGQRFRNFRNWSAEGYAAIADHVIQSYGARVILTGGRTSVEQEYGQSIGRLARRPLVNLIGQTSLKQLLALIERASVVLCPDSGPAHMATAVGTQVVGLYATSNRFRTGPYLSQNLVVDRYPDAVRAELGRPIEALRWGQRVRNPNAMALISVADVIEKIDLAFGQADAERIPASPG